MRTFSQFQQDFSKVHDCSRSHGKEAMVQFGIEGAVYCAYCKKLIDGISITQEELYRWLNEQLRMV